MVDIWKTQPEVVSTRVDGQPAIKIEAILEADEEPPPGTPAGKVFLQRLT